MTDERDEERWWRTAEWIIGNLIVVIGMMIALVMGTNWIIATPSPGMPSKSIAVVNESKTIGSTLTADALKNASYGILFSEGQLVTLKDGRYLGLDARDPALHFDVAIYDNKITFGDLDDDADQDAAIILTVNGGGSGSFRELALVRNEGGMPLYAASTVLGDRTIIHSLNINDGVITIDLTYAGPNDPACCPTVRKAVQYKLSENGLDETHPER